MILRTPAKDFPPKHSLLGASTGNRSTHGTEFRVRERGFSRCGLWFLVRFQGLLHAIFGIKTEAE